MLLMTFDDEDDNEVFHGFTEQVTAAATANINKLLIEWYGSYADMY